MSYLPEFVRELTLPPVHTFNVWHPQLVHFPIALLFVAPVFILLGLFLCRVRQCLLWSALILMVLGTFSAWLAVSSGQAAAELVVNRGAAVQEVLEQHEEMAKGSLTVFSALAALFALLLLGMWACRKIRPATCAAPNPTSEAPPTSKTCYCRSGQSWVLVIYLVLYAGGLFLLTNAAHRGGTLVHQYGVRAPVSDPKLTFPTSAPTSTGAPREVVLENLQAAYHGESNAHNRYLAFAKKAEEEGYTPVASLFRAAAESEKIHAANHARVIRKMGPEPKAVLETPPVGSTAENLKAAIQGESYERDVMYPGFIATAQMENNLPAVRTFNLAMLAEAEHAKLYQQALDNLAQWKGSPKTFYVCSICGFTTLTLPDQVCPACFNPKEKFQAIQ